MPVDFQLVRHATCVVTVGAVRFVVDPMLAASGTLPHVGLTRGAARNPLVDAPDLGGVADEAARILVTHVHFDHFDAAARARFADGARVVASRKVATALARAGLGRVTAIGSGPVSIGDVRVAALETRHAHGPLGWVLGKNTAFTLDHGADRVLITGDAVVEDVREIARRWRPSVVVVNVGAATFRLGQRATMDAAEVRALAEEFVDAAFLVVHLDALNHCVESREWTRSALAGLPRVVVPDDGQRVRV